MTKYASHVSTRVTPQSEAARGDQKANNAGGFVFTLDKWARLDRWLILGAEGGTYYVGEKKLTKDNAQTILDCLKEDGPRTVAKIVEISDAGRAPKNDPAIFALAMAAADDKIETRRAALAALPKVCRIGTHLFHFVQSVEQFRGWGRALRDAVAHWYLDKPIDALAYQAVKYQQRDGWSHRDVLRLSHTLVSTDDAKYQGHDALFRWIVTGAGGLDAREVKRRKNDKREVLSQYGAISVDALPKIVSGYEKLKVEKDSKVVAKLIAEYGFTHEMIPTEHKNSIDVWAALLEKMPMTAMIRNLGKMTAIGLLKPMSEASKKVAATLVDEPALKKARVHPIALLSALKIYEQGHGEKGSLTWSPDSGVINALDAGFYLAFKAIEPTNKNIMLAIDVSGSMDGNTIAGMSHIDARMGSAAMAMATVQTEPHYVCMGFTCAAATRSGRGYGGMWGGGDATLTPINLTPRQRLDDVCKKMRELPMGGTDCALPMIWAMQNKIEVDCFQVYTDSETWAGNIHPFQALKQYRQVMGRDAKLVVVGMTATEFTIADPNDGGMMDVVGFDTAAPSVMADFVRGGSASVRVNEKAVL